MLVKLVSKSSIENENPSSYNTQSTEIDILKLWRSYFPNSITYGISINHSVHCYCCHTYMIRFSVVGVLLFKW